MFDEILACLDGSPLAETILPLARSLTRSATAKLTVVTLPVGSDDPLGAERYLRNRASSFDARFKLLTGPEPAEAIVAELNRNRHALAALTTHGRTALGEALLGSVALKVVQRAGRPVIVYRAEAATQKPPDTIRTIAVALEGGDFSERILPAAIELTKVVRGDLLLIQVLPAGFPQSAAPDVPIGDFLDSAYLHHKAAAIEKKHGIQVSWDVLYGEPGDSICRYLRGTRETLLAMTTHARSALQRALVGSVTADCIRNCAVPMMILWPRT